jgi:hypothetical protein
MTTASHALSSASAPAPLRPAIIRRRSRPLLLAPPPVYAAPSLVGPTIESVASGWQDDLRFFLGCYVAGLVFFLIMLS